MTSLTFAVLGLLLLFIVWRLVKFLIYPKRLNEYFCNAVRVFIWKGEEDARLAALSAAMTADNVQRTSQLNYLDGIQSDLLAFTQAFNKFDDKNTEVDFTADMLRVHSRLALLQQQIASKNFSIDTLKNSRIELDTANKEYSIALKKGDPTVFVKKYPDLFRPQT